MNPKTTKCLIGKFVLRILTINFFWILKCRVYFLYISHLLNNSIIGFYIFTSFGFYIFTSFGFYIFTSFVFYIFTSLHLYIFCFFELLLSLFFPSEFPSQWKYLRNKLWFWFTMLIYLFCLTLKFFIFSREHAQK